MTAAPDRDPFHLRRFVDAQAPVIGRVRTELAAGRKQSHWMWFVFPQIAGLGSSAMSARYAIGGAGEARAYLAHPLLGARLIELTGVVNALEAPTARAIFGSPDYLKFHSCMTLFAEVAKGEAVFARALERYFGGARDAATLARLGDG
ncbi:MAG: DUF1810 domain-containing protein [Caulobacteraceae bacterium]